MSDTTAPTPAPDELVARLRQASSEWPRGIMQELVQQAAARIQADAERIAELEREDFDICIACGALCRPGESHECERSPPVGWTKILYRAADAYGMTGKHHATIIKAAARIAADAARIAELERKINRWKVAADLETLHDRAERAEAEVQRLTQELNETREREKGLCAYAGKLREVVAAADAMREYAEVNECRHEETHRGGAIWTICDGCGRNWADDQGGFVPYQQPDPLSSYDAARAKLERT